MPILIDGESYEYKGTIECSKGSGDSEEKFSFTAYSDHDGAEHWLLVDKGAWSLFRHPEGAAHHGPVAKTHEEFSADKVTVLGKERGRIRFEWVTLQIPFKNQPSPYDSTAEAMLYGPAGADRKAMMSVPLLKMGSTDTYYSASFPAARMPRESVAVHSAPPGGNQLATVVCALMACVFGAAFFLKNPVPVQIFWWAGPLAVLCRFFSQRQGPADHLFRLVGGLFFLHFATHAIDYNITADWDEAAEPIFESLRLCLFSLGLLALKKFKPQAYFATLDGSAVFGGCSWLTFIGVMCFIAMSEDGDNLFPWFNWYSGMTPWSYFWLVAVVCGIAYRYHDYRKVPMHLRGFRSLLYKTLDVLEQKLEVVVSKSKKLVEWADDLEDALNISPDPIVVSLALYGPSFLAWRDQAKKLDEIDPQLLEPQESEALEADLRIIAGDFKALVACIDAWPQGCAELRTLRCSPRLGTWGQ